jgi:hypothetical protein
MKRAIPEGIDLSLLEYLQYGDLTLIAEEDRKENPGKKTDVTYVSKVCKGKHRNDRILKRAFEKALKRKGEFPMQAIKH